VLPFAAMSLDTSLVYILLYISLYFEVFLLLSFMAHKRHSTELNTADNSLKYSDLPTATVIVPCYNEQKTLAGTLESLLTLDYPTDKLNITVVNDGSKDNTLQIAQEYARKYKQVRVLDKENGGKASAMNLAIRECDTELVGCLDADSFVDPDAMMLIAHRFEENPEISAVTPAVLVHNPINILQKMQRAEYMIGVFMRRVFSIIDSIIVTPGPFSIFRREHILSISQDSNNVWQHAHGTEDFEMGLRLQSKFKKIANEPRAQVLTISPNTVYSLYRQRLRWVYGFLMNAYDYKYMILNHKYSNVGMFVLPTALFSVFGAIYMFALFIFNIAKWIIDLTIQIYTTGISLSWPKFELFYINANTMMFVILALLAMLLMILHYSSAMSGVKVHKRDTALYIILYGFISPLWLTSAAARAMVGKESKWRVIR
jgi:cellulose synthase/poly-beta-1,6-N-acetylglucosamine synthase-like glycosyltransferase